MLYTIIKLLHVTFATLSITGFISRGILKFNQSPILQRRWIRILPHINDTLLLLFAIILVILSGYNPLHDSWLAAKIILLVFYIGFGALALRLAKSRTTQITFFILAILTFSWIVHIALSKTVFFIQ